MEKGSLTQEELEQLRQWLQERPSPIQELATRFPPGCFVKAREGVTLMVPGPGWYARVVSYYENDEMGLGVEGMLAAPGAGMVVAEVNPDDVEIYAYALLRPEDVQELLVSS